MTEMISVLQQLVAHGVAGSWTPSRSQIWEEEARTEGNAAARDLQRSPSQHH